MSRIVSTRGRGDKPAKPHPDFPLTAHPNGQWSKKVRGKVHYFGPWADPDAALARWLEVKDDLLAGRIPRPKDGFTVRDLCNHFLTFKLDQLRSGEISARTFHDYERVAERVVSVLDRHRLVEDLGPDDFQKLREHLADKMGPVGLGNEISRIRVIFNFAFNNGHVDRPVRFGMAFRRPSKRVLRQERNKRGARMFEADEIRTLIEAADPQVKAMILLGVNCGFGNTDCSTLPKTALDLEAGWVDFPRPKTAIARRCPLWPETVDAIRAAMDARPAPQEPQDDGLVFLTKYGRRWVRTSPSKKTEGKLTAFDSLAQAVRKLMKEAGLPTGRNFYALRHTFETIGGEAKDQVAVNFIMGHVDDSMAAHYRERISDDRLRTVTDHVRQWLFDSAS